MTISGNDEVRVFRVSANVQFTLRNLTIVKGRGETGGAVCNEGGTVIATNCIFSGHAASGQMGMEYGGDGTPGSGGAIYNTGIFHASGCAFVGNSAIGGRGATGDYGGMKPEGMGGLGGQAMGGAVYNSGSVLIERSLFASNSVVGGTGGQGWNAFRVTDQHYYGGPGGHAGAAEGAALFAAGPSTLVNCTIGGNQSIGGDGGHGGNGTTWDIPHGGGVEYTSGGCGGEGGWGNGAIYDGAAWLQLLNCTVARNTSLGGTGGSGGLDGSYCNPASSGGNGTAMGGVTTAGGTLLNTLLATNTPTNGTGLVSDAGHNLSSDDSCAFTNLGSLNNTNPKLGPLAHNGGPTLTLALLPDSPAIDAGDSAASPPTDQRGVPRTYGQAADIGAFEYWLTAHATANPNGGVDVAAWGIAGQKCCLLVSPDLVSWTPAATNQIGADGTALFHDEATGPSSRHYRFKLE